MRLSNRYKGDRNVLASNLNENILRSERKIGKKFNTNKKKKIHHTGECVLVPVTDLHHPVTLDGCGARQVRHVGQDGDHDDQRVQQVQQRLPRKERRHMRPEVDGDVNEEAADD